MAYIVNTTNTQVTTAGTSCTATLGTHATNDLLAVFVAQDAGTGTISAPAGWTILGTQAAGGGVRAVWAYKVAASGSETDPAFTSTLSDEWTATALVIRDADPTNPFGATPTSGTDFFKTDHASAASFAVSSGAVTTAANGCLLIHGFAINGNTRYGRANLSDLTCAAKQVAGTISNVVGYRQQESSGASPAVTCYLSAAETGQSWVIAVRNKTNGALQPDIRPTITTVRYYGDFGVSDATTTWEAASAFAATINGISTSAVAPTMNATTITDDPWGTYSSIGCLDNTASLIVGGSHTISSTDFTGKVFGVSWSRTDPSTSALQGAEGVLVGFSDGTNWSVYQLASKTHSWPTAGSVDAWIDLNTATTYATSGTLNKAAVTRIGYFWHRTGSSPTAHSLRVKAANLWGSTAITGGGSARPATFVDLRDALVSWGGFRYAELQGSAQVLGKTAIQIGDGTNSTYFDSSASSFEYPQAWSATTNGNWQMAWNVGANALTVGIYAKSTDTINLAAGVCATSVEQNFTINASSSTSATYSFSGESIVGFLPTWLTGVNPTGATFSRCDEIDAKGSDWADCTIKATTSTDAAIAFSADGGSMDNCTIDVTGTSAAYHLELGTAVTAISLTDVTFTGTPTTDKVHVKKTTGTVTITIDGTTSLVAGDVTSDGASVSIVAPTLERGQNFTGLVAGSKVKVFTSGTQTVLYGTDSSGTSFAWDDATAGSITVDYTIQKAGYIPIRVTGVVLTGAVGTGQVDTPISQVVDRAYSASSGLTYGTTAVVTVGTNPTTNPGTKTFQLTTASTGQNWYSFWIEQWIDKGDTGEALANVAFPLQANGPNSFTLLNGWEFSDGATSIAFLSRDGLRYVNASGTRTAAWAAILTAGVPSGARVRYQQSDGGTTGSAVVTSGNMDELLQVYGDATHGNFDRTGYLVLKVQEMGYDQAETDVYATYGALEDQLYVVGLAPTANSVATGNPALANPPTITDHGASPVTWNSKAFSITITDSAAGNTGTDIMKWLRYNFETGGTFQGKDAFNWHDLVQQNGDDFKTVRGKVYGDVGASLKGVRVVQNDGTSAHADFTLFTADDGTTYAPPPAATVTVTGLTSGSRVQLYDTANSTELYNAVVGATSLNYSETYSVDRTVRIRITYVSGATAKEMIEATVGSITSGAPNLTYVASQANDSTYNTNAVDGSTVTGITINDTTDRAEIAIAGGAVTWANIYAYQVYWLNTETGIRDDFAFINAPDTANYILTGFKIKNTHATAALTITGGWGRDATTGLSSTVIDTASTANIYLAPDHVVPYSTGSGLTAGQDAKLTAIDAATTAYLDATVSSRLAKTAFLALK